MVAVIRNLADIAASNMSIATLTDLSRQTVVRCEKQADMAVNCAFRFYHDYAEERMLDHETVRAGRPNRMFISCHDFSSDATDSGVWRNSKLQGLQVRSTYLSDHTSVFQHKLFEQCLVAYEAFTDI